MYIGLHVNYPLFLSYFNDTWIFTKDFQKNFMKIRPIAAELFQVDRHDKANIHFPQFCECA